MSKYLLDTDICIYYLKRQHGIAERVQSARIENCFISEITLAELKFGAANSLQIEQNIQIVASFQNIIQILPIFGSLDFYASEKARLRKQGTPVDEFDLLIGATAVTNGLVMATNNTAHFSRITGIVLADWMKQ
ncbi:MAG: type II toxin-antitoxin system VapC family toxin [Bacteroidia bacterium]|nr:type II toxin-antitoxin system VapC family toxin [Bacteroidia bacterium]